MAPPIVGNARVFSGHQPWPPAAFTAAVPTSPVAVSLFSPIKCNPLAPFYRFSPLPRSPMVPSHLPTVALSLPCRWTPPAAPTALPVRRPAAPSPPPASPPPPPPRPALRFPRRPPELPSRRRPSLSSVLATSSRTSRLARAPSGCAATSPGVAAASSFPASPPFRGEITGDASSPTTSGVATTPPSPAIPAASPERRPTSPSPPSASPHRPPPRLLLGFAGTPSPRRPLHPLRRRRPFGRPFLLPGSSACCTTTTSGIAAARSSSASFPLHPNPSAVHHRRLRSFSSSTSRRSPGSSSRGAASVIVIAAACSTSSSSPCSRCRLSSSPPRRSRSSSSSSSSRRSRSSWRSSLRRAVLVRRPRSSSEPPQPRHRLRPRLRIVKPRAGRVSPSSKDRRRSRSLASPRSAFVVPEVPEAWFVVVAEGSEGRSL
ncbi:uncharacterized protein [Oryza sativa Japonica Group]|uniref:uncharacterized protein isoform X1 n=1 Tax=Oryza sativa subsp. japonica TaxID=39947 RepID=UPI00339C34A4